MLFIALHSTTNFNPPVDLENAMVHGQFTRYLAFGITFDGAEDNKKFVVLLSNTTGIVSPINLYSIIRSVYFLTPGKIYTKVP